MKYRKVHKYHKSRKQIVNKHISIAILKASSCFFTIGGGILLALKLDVSGYGFLFLAMGSSQMLLANIFLRDKSMIIYAASIFIFVDCLGVYRWLLA